MNPFATPIKFKKEKSNHFYAIKENNQFLKINNPDLGQEVYEIPCVSGGESKPLVLEIPIPLCEKHRESHNNQKFGVHTCNNWYYIAIPTELGSLICRECKNELFLPQPFLRSANLSYANLSSANLRYADLRSANLSSANLSSANLRYADLRSANLSSANLRSANLRSANLRYADLRYADLSYADLSSARNINESININNAHWNKFTIIDKEYKRLLKKDRIL